MSSNDAPDFSIAAEALAASAGFFAGQKAAKAVSSALTGTGCDVSSATKDRTRRDASGIGANYSLAFAPLRPARTDAQRRTTDDGFRTTDDGPPSCRHRIVAGWK